MDKKMERTKKRALVKGVIKTNSAVLYAAILGLLGFWALAYTNWLTFWIGVAAFVGYVGLYDLAKRHTVHSTLIGTLPGGASLVAGYTAVTNRLDARACLLFIIMAAWQMAHFYAIAVYRRDDYAKAGLPVMSVKHGIKATKFQIIFYIVIFGIAAIFLDGYGKKSYIYVTLAGAVSAYWLVRSLINYRNQESTKWARTVFKDSLMVLMVLMVAIAASPLLP